MQPKSMLAVLATLGVSVAGPLDQSLQARGNTPSKPQDIKCSGEIIGYRTITNQDDADYVNAKENFPKKDANGIDLGKKVVYLSDGFGDYQGGGSGVHWCVAYADKGELSKAHKVWFPETEPAKTCARFSDSKVDTWILMASKDKFVPDKTLRFAQLETYLQMAIPFDMLETMKVCAKCYPKAEAMEMTSEFPRIDWKTSAYTGKNTLQKRDSLDARAAASACPVKASSSASRSKATPTTLKATPTTKVKATTTSKPKMTPTAKPSKTKTKKTKTKTKKTKTKKIKTKKPKKPRATGVIA